MVEGIWKSKARAREEIVNGKQVKDLWKMESQGLANHGVDKGRER